MEYRLSRQVIDPEVIEIVSREIRKQKMPVTRASKKRLLEIAEVAKVIKRFGIPKHLVCRKLPHKLGNGIFLRPDAKPILRNEVIAPYAGIVSVVQENGEDDSAYAFAPISAFHLSKEEQKQFDPKNRYHPRRLYSIKLDAEKKGNFTRFINHSVTPNVVALGLSTPKTNTAGLDPMPIEIVYVAKKTIHPGEQLLVCYEAEDDSYWGAFDIEPFVMTPETFRVSPSLKVIETR